MDTNAKLNTMRERLSLRPPRVMIIGLGSVGNFLLSYLLGSAKQQFDITVVGRNAEKMESDVNIAVVASLIRGQCHSCVTVEGGVDLDDVDSIASCFSKYSPDIVINSSRVYAGLKYGSISWSNVRAYGIWTPLSIRYIRNIMEAYALSNCEAVVVNTSYSDATIPWLRSAGMSYPDFGSGNLNHIVPRLKMSAANLLGVDDFWNVEIDLATGHFHDVVVSKEGHDEGVRQLVSVTYDGAVQNLDYDALFAGCAIPMPTDQKRNMMNASSNFNIIDSLIGAVNRSEKRKFFSPGAFGNLGGYPVIVDGSGEDITAAIDESVFTMNAMREKNAVSLALDGVEGIHSGVLSYTDDLIAKARDAFGVDLPKRVSFDEIDEVASFIVSEIIEPQLAKRG